MYRKDFTQLTAQEKDRLATGLNQLWNNNSIQAFANLHHVNFDGGIIHWSPAFLPWHRDFLRKLELELQAIDSLITLPYWDWTRPDSRDLDVEPWKSFFGGRNNTGGNFDTWSYSRMQPSPATNTLPTLSDIVLELSATSYSNYRTIESGSHFPGHNWTGGTMATPSSPLDPLFYLHHCNIDRLWAIWQQNNSSMAQYDTTIIDGDINPNPNVVGLNQSMQIGTTATPADMLDHTSLGYLYERDILLEIEWFNTLGSVLQTGDSRSPDLFIPDSVTDTGIQPSPSNHWSSPNIWVRNNPPTSPGENPTDGHQVPIVDEINYMYVKVENIGTTNASNISVNAYHCNPGTGMLWPDDFVLIDTISSSATLTPGSNEIVGPFEWTPTVEDHECLLAIVDSTDDPNSMPMFHSSVPHWQPVRFENHVGQRNVSPIRVVRTSSRKSSIRIGGGIKKTTNVIEIDARKLPKNSNIWLNAPTTLVKNAKLEKLKKVDANTRFTTLKMGGKSLARINGVKLKPKESKRLKLWMTFSKNARSEKEYPIFISQIQDKVLAGKITLGFFNVGESDKYVYGNPRSKELHTTKCPFWSRISDKNKVPFEEIEEGLVRGYNGCAFCLPEYNTG